MKCPRCETAGLEEREREGVPIDVCPQCRGIWLDRGELERLIARAMEEQEAIARRAGGRAEEREYRDDRDDRDDREHGRGRDYDDRGHGHHHDDDHGHDSRQGYGRKRSWLDIFD
ncbi:MAG: hypothetical protein FIA95_15680 [Gemmatimonadetes bacterium]|nr:hypothetical protein [Gemmatimonadota bacterium]